jgi:hypothetical protein
LTFLKAAAKNYTTLAGWYGTIYILKLLGHFNKHKQQAATKIVNIIG